MADNHPTTSFRAAANARNARYRAKKRTENPFKKCARCGEIKPLSEFTFSKTEKRHKSHCSTCRHDAYMEQREKAIARSAAHYRKNREAVLAKTRQRRRENLPQQLFRAARGRARVKGLAFDITPEDVIVPAICPVLGIPLRVGNGLPIPNSPTIDRIDSSRGYVRGNILVVSQKANTIKSNATPEELQAVADFYRRLSEVPGK